MSLQVIFPLEAIVALRTLERSFVLVHGLNMSSKFRRLCKSLSACDADGSRSCFLFSILKLLVYFLWVLRYLKRVVGGE
jgi:hypothetical protein